MVDRKEKEDTTRCTEQVDLVNSPPHYNNGGVECIDYIEQQLGKEFAFYCQGNVIKYIHRWRYKGNGSEDLRKAQWDLSRMITSLERSNEI